MKTPYEELSTEKQAEVRRTFEAVAAERSLTANERADLAYLLGMPAETVTGES